MWLNFLSVGVIGGVLGGPVDLAAMAMRPFGYSTEKPIMGSEWIGQKLQDRGLVSDKRNPVAEALMGIGVPMGALKAAPAVFKAEQAMLTNALETAGENATHKLADVLTKNANFGKISPGLPAPSAPLRSFDLDYPRPIAEPQGSPLAFSIDGDPLTAPLIAGRRMVGGVDEALQRGEASYAAGMLGVTPQQVSARNLGANTAGSFKPMFSDSGRFQGPTEIKILNSLNPQDANQVMGHEFGHLIDNIISDTSSLSSKGLSKELDFLYDALNKKRAGSKQWTPAADGYSTKEAPKEKWAEALRAYQEDPNFIKTAAPNVAKEIRKQVNTNQRLNKVIDYGSGRSSTSGTTT